MTGIKKQKCKRSRQHALDDRESRPKFCMGHWCVSLLGCSCKCIPSFLPHGMTINQMIRQRVSYNQ